MGQKPRVCSSYFFEMEDGSRIEGRFQDRGPAGAVPVLAAERKL